jgi:ATP-dependent DNA helicase DinG
VVEAGTGTGKTLAYLVPAILSGTKVVVSTATKALQEQLVEKDLPLLRSIGV